MLDENGYYLIKATALPEILIKVLNANTLLKSGEAKSASEAARMSGISRSVFYKYKDAIKPFYDKTSSRIVTISVILKDLPGILNSFINTLTGFGVNILTINQNIPVNDLAPVTVSFKINSEQFDMNSLISKLSETYGICNVDILAGE